MKKFSSLRMIGVLCLVFTIPGSIYAQEGEILTKEDRDRISSVDQIEPSDTAWKFNTTIGFNFNQSYFSNWAAGGQNSVSATALTSFTAIYKKNRSSWVNNLDLAYGLLSQNGNEPIKTDDRIDLSSKYGYQSKNRENLFYTALLNFRTQFAPGFEIQDGEEVGMSISDFLAPAFAIASLGMDYKPGDAFSAYLSPATTKFSIVTIDRLAPEFGVDEGENVRVEVGAFAKFIFKKEIFENVKLDTRLDLFSNYSKNPENIDVNWETLISMKVNKWLNTTLTTQLIYDDDVLIVNEDGTGRGPKTQFREVFALGISISL